MHFAHGSLSPPSSEASSKRQGDGQRFQKKSYENHKSKRSVSTGECPAIVGFKNQQDSASRVCPALHQSQIAHRNGFELFADTVAEAIRIRRGCRQMDLARCFTGSETRSGQLALGFGFPLESAARCMATSVWQFQPVRHPSRRPARQISLLLSRRRSTRLKRQAP